MFRGKTNNMGSEKGGSIRGSNKNILAAQAIPAYFQCSLSQQLMEEPTITKCGHMYDREAIVQWLQDVRPSARELVISL